LSSVVQCPAAHHIDVISRHSGFDLTCIESQTMTDIHHWAMYWMTACLLDYLRYVWLLRS